MVLKLAILAAAALMIAWMVAVAIQTIAAIAVVGATCGRSSDRQVCIAEVRP